MMPSSRVSRIESPSTWMQALMHPSAPLKPLESFQFQEIEGSGRAAKEVTKIRPNVDAFVYNSSASKYTITPVHAAVVMSYRHGAANVSRSYLVLQHLIDHGADLEAKCSRVSACKIPGYNWLGISGTALDIALTLKAKSRGDWMIDLVTFLYKQSSGAKSLALPMTKVPVVARNVWRELLLNELCSDVTLVCRGQELPAHSCVLACASDYFRQMFTGPWRTQVIDGRLSTNVSADAMRAVLSFIYVGEIEEAVIDAHAEEVFSVAQQYFLADLGKLAEAKLLSSIGVDNLKKLLLLAHLHDATMLKEQCFAFVRQNKVSALTDPSMLCLATENPTLWAEIVTMASANEPAAKRARTQ
jgi:hypothetical protein